MGYMPENMVALHYKPYGQSKCLNSGQSNCLNTAKQEDNTTFSSHNLLWKFQNTNTVYISYHIAFMMVIIILITPS